MKKGIILFVSAVFLFTCCSCKVQDADSSGDKMTTEAVVENSIEITTENGIDVPDVDTGENPFTVHGTKWDADRVMDEPDYELLSLYACQESDMELYTYRDESICNSNNNIILKTNDKYVVYNDRVLFYEMISDIETYEEYGYSFIDPVHYIEGDFDDDGDIELACSFIMDRGSSYMNNKLFVFDYNKEQDSYELYGLKLADFSDIVTEVISKHYSSEYELSEVDTVDSDGAVSMCSGMLLAEGQPTVKWGMWESVTLGNGKPMNIGTIVNEYPDGVQWEAAEVRYNVFYQGNGVFEVSLAEYEEYPCY